MNNRLRVIRAKNRVTQFQLRLMTGIYQSKLSMAENDLIDLTEGEKKKLAKALGVSVNEVWPSQGVEGVERAQGGSKKERLMCGRARCISPKNSQWEPSPRVTATVLGRYCG